MTVWTPGERQGRYGGGLEHYSKVINIEARTTLGMARRQLIPATLEFLSDVANTAASKKAVSSAISIRTEEQILTSVSANVDDMNEACNRLDDLMHQVSEVEGSYELARFYSDNIVPAIRDIREAADRCEIHVGKDYWPLPSYAQMLFYV